MEGLRLAVVNIITLGLINSSKMWKIAERKGNWVWNLLTNTLILTK
jgi:hypothetical protein